MRRLGPKNLRLIAAMWSISALVFVAFGTVAAQEPSADDSAIAIRDVDGVDPDAVVVDFLFTGPRDAVSDLVIRENGVIVEHTAPVRLSDERGFGTVLAIDSSGSMAEGGAFDLARQAAVDFVDAKEPGDQIAVVAFSTTARVVSDFTDDGNALVAAISDLEAEGGTALYDAISTSVSLFSSQDLVPNIVLLTDGADSDSTATESVAQTELEAAGAVLFGVGLETPELDLTSLQRLAEGTGGSARTSAEAADLTAIYRDIQSTIRRQFRTTFVSQTEREAGRQTLTLTIGNASTTESFLVSARLEPTADPVVIPSSGGGIDALQSGPFLWIGILLAILAAAGVIFAIATTVVPDNTGLDSLLRPYAEGFVAPDEEEEGMVTSAILQRAVDLTGQFAERRGVLTRLEGMLERASLPLRAGEALFFYLAAVALALVLAAALLSNIVGALLITLIGALIPPAVLAQLASRRRRQFEEQLPDMLNLLSSTLRAGYSFMQGVEAAAQEVAEPMKRELGRVVTEARLGMPLEEALNGVVRRMESKDFDWAVMAIAIQREVGGNLSELLSTVADTMIERERLRRDVQTLTAEGRVSSYVLGALPIGLGIFMFSVNPDYMEPLTDDSFGIALLVAAGLLMGAGFIWMNKIIKIEV